MKVKVMKCLLKGWVLMLILSPSCSWNVWDAEKHSEKFYSYSAGSIKPFDECWIELRDELRDSELYDGIDLISQATLTKYLDKADVDYSYGHILHRYREDYFERTIEGYGGEGKYSHWPYRRTGVLVIKRYNIDLVGGFGFSLNGSGPVTKERSYFDVLLYFAPLLTSDFSPHKTPTPTKGNFSLADCQLLWSAIFTHERRDVRSAEFGEENFSNLITRLIQIGYFRPKL